MEFNISDQKLFKVLMADKTFYNVYIKNYLKRFLKDYDEEILNAFIEFNSNKIIDIKDILDLSDNINYEYQAFGFRTFNIRVNKSIPKEKLSHDYIHRRVQTLLNCYHGFWSENEVLEKEAYFHIQLLKIIPFNVNNETIIQLILMSNLINYGFPPFLLNNEETKEYIECIKTKDALRFRKLILKKIKEEFEHVTKLYIQYYDLPKNRDIRELLLLKV